MSPNSPSTPGPPAGSVPPPQEVDGAEADLFDYAKIRDYLVYVVHAVGRRRILTALVFVSVVASSVLAFVVLPRSYHCEIKIQAQRNMVISTLAGLNRSWDWDLPTKAAADVVLRHDNLVAIVRKTDLVRAWESSRAPVLRMVDAVRRLVRGELPADVREEMLVGTLEQRLAVQSTEETVTIGVDWPDARTAYRIIQVAHENFLESRQYKEVSAVSDAIGLLEGRASNAREKVNDALERVLKLRATAQPGKVVPERPRPARPAVALDPNLQRLRSQLQSKRQVILDMEEFRRRLAELASKLVELKQVYSEFHPAVIDLEQTIQEQEREENPQLALLRHEYRQIEDEYEKRGGPALAAPESLSSARLPAEALQIGRAIADEGESAEIEQAKGDLKHEIGRYSSLTERIEQAKLELDTQRAAFQYRYGVLRPASVPPSPEKPKKLQLIGGGVVLGLVLAVLAAALADLRSGRILERWQVERQLGLPVLGEVPAP